MDATDSCTPESQVAEARSENCFEARQAKCRNLGTFDISSEGYCTDLQSYALLQFSSPRRIDQHYSW